MIHNRLALIAILTGMAYRNEEVGIADGGRSNEQIAAEKAAADARADEASAQREAAAKQQAAEAKAAAKAAEKAAKAEKTQAEKAARAAQVAAQKQAKLDAKAAKEAEKLAKKQEAEKAKQTQKLPESNGITRPKAGTITGSVWAAADEVSAAKKEPATIAEVMAKLPTVADATIKTQYARWRKYFGITGRLSAPAAPATAQTGTATTTSAAEPVNQVPAPV